MWTQNNVTDDTNANCDTEDDMIHMFTNNMNLTWCSQVTVVDVEQNATRQTRFVFLQNSV